MWSILYLYHEKLAKILEYYRIVTHTHYPPQQRLLNTDLMSGLASHLAVSQDPSINASLLTKEAIMAEFPRVFDGIMDGEKFHIHLTTNAKPFCMTSPRTILGRGTKNLATATDHCPSHCAPIV